MIDNSSDSARAGNPNAPAAAHDDGTWRVQGVLTSLTHDVDRRRFIASIDIAAGTLTLFISARIGDLENPVLQVARGLIGQRVVA